MEMDAMETSIPTAIVAPLHDDGKIVGKNDISFQDINGLRGLALLEFYENYVDREPVRDLSGQIRVGKFASYVVLGGSFVSLVSGKISLEKFLDQDFFTLWVSSLFTSAGLWSSPLLSVIAYVLGLSIGVYGVVGTLSGNIDIHRRSSVLTLIEAGLCFVGFLLVGFFFDSEYKYKKRIVGAIALILIVLFSVANGLFCVTAYREHLSCSESSMIICSAQTCLFLSFCLIFLRLFQKVAFLFIVSIGELFVGLAAIGSLLCHEWTHAIYDSMGMAVTLLGVSVILACRRRALGYISRQAAGDMDRYQSAWLDVARDSPQDLASLGALWATVMATAATSPSRTELKNQLPNSSGNPTSIIQLFDMADLVNPLLQRKAQQWAAASGGTALAEVQVKGVRRAVQKCYRSYNKDWSRLCDLCRTSIIFDDISNLVKCLTLIASDSDVRLYYRHQDKMRLRSDYDYVSSLGYRDVQLCVAIVEDEALRRGLGTHLCEVQLHLRCLYQIKSDEGHAQYRRMRSIKAE